MPRILGVDIPNDKRTVISLRYIYGIGPFLAQQLCERTGISADKRARDLSEDELAKLAVMLDNEYVVEGQLRRQIQQNIGRLREIGSYRGLRHRKGLPFMASAPGPTPAPARGRGRRSPARRASRRCAKTRARAEAVPAWRFASRLGPGPAEGRNDRGHFSRLIASGSGLKPTTREQRTCGQGQEAKGTAQRQPGGRAHQGDLQQHDGHDNRSQRRCVVLGFVGDCRLQRKPQEHPVRGTRRPRPLRRRRPSTASRRLR